MKSRGGRPGFPVPYGFCGREATLEGSKGGGKVRSCVKVEVAVLVSKHGA